MPRVIIDGKAYTEHCLKVDSGPFRAIQSGEKTFEFRRNDRGFAVGHVLFLCELHGGELTGRTSRHLVTYILHGGSYGVPDDFCVMSIVPLL